MPEHPSSDGLVLWDAAWLSYQSGTFELRFAHQVRRVLGFRGRLLARADWESRWDALAADGLDNPLMWAITGMDPSVADSWLSQCRRKGWEQWVALGWLTSLRINPLFIAAGVLPEEYEVIRPYLTRAKKRPPRDMDRVTEIVVALSHAWGAYDIPLSVAWQWRKLGFCDPEVVAQWRNRGFSPNEAAQLDLMGLSAQDAVYLHVALASAREENDESYDDVDDDDIEFSAMLDWGEFEDDSNDEENPNPTFS
jgi:hypothetical protein